MSPCIMGLTTQHPYIQKKAHRVFTKSLSFVLIGPKCLLFFPFNVQSQDLLTKRSYDDVENVKILFCFVLYN